MLINRIFELSLVLNTDKFNKIVSKCYCADDYSDENNSEFEDHSMAHKGIIVQYRASNYKKRIRVIADAAIATGGNLSDHELFVSKLEKHIKKYFQSELGLEDFKLSGLSLCARIYVGDREHVTAYLRAVRRIGRVKGFTPVTFEDLSEDSSFCLRGISNDVVFLLYDLERVIDRKEKPSSVNLCVGSAPSSKYKGMLQTEVCLTKAKAIRKYCCSYTTSEQIISVSEKEKNILMEYFTRIIPYGDYHKKEEAVKIIKKNVTDAVVGRRMLRLLSLIPEKKSLHLAQKSMSYRHPDALLVEFAKLNLSPITISSRQNTKYMQNLYNYLDI